MISDNDLHDLYATIGKQNAAMRKAVIALTIIQEKNDSLAYPSLLIIEQTKDALEALC
jgi:hypothetical protein